MASKPPDFKVSGIRAERIIASGSGANPRMLLIGSGATGNDGTSVNTNQLILAGTGSNTWLFISGSIGGNDRVTFGGDVTISGTIYDAAGAPFVGGGGGGSSNWNELSPSPRLNSTASVAIAGGHGSSFAAQSAGTDVFFFVSGSTAGTNISLFSGNVISSGTINIKNTSGATVFTATNLGAVSGSGNLQVGGTLTVAGSTTLGDASGDAVTINASSVSIPNNLTFDSTLFHLDSSNNRVGVKNNSPEYDFVVNGDTRLGAAGGDNHYMTGTFRQLGDSFLFGTVIIGVDASDQHQVTGTLDLLHELYVRTGPSVLSGTVIIGNNQVTQHQVTGTLNLQNDLFVSGTMQIGTIPGVNHYITGTLNVKDGVAIGTGEITTTASEFKLANVSTPTVRIGGDADVFIGGSSKNVTIPGNFTVNGTTTIINTVNLVVKDPLIYIASGSASSNQNGGIAIASGSSVVNEALVIGRMDNDTWGVGRKDVVGGTSTDLTAGVTLVAMRASRFEFTPDVAMINNGTGNLTLSGSNISFTVGGTNKVVFSSDGIQKLGISSDVSLTTISGSNNQDVKLAAGTGTGNLTLSGSNIDLTVGGTNKVVFSSDGIQKLGISSGGSLTTISGSNNQDVKLAAGTGTGTLSLSGSSILIDGAGSTAVQLRKDSINYAFIGTSNSNEGFHPGSSSTYDLGSITARWRNIYTGDLHLKNDRGDWTMIEEEDYLSLKNNKTGKRFKILTEEIPD